MSVAALEFPGWLKLGDAAKEYGLKYETLRRLVKNNTFSRGNFTNPDADTPPIYVRIAELEAWKRGGVDAVQRLREHESKQPFPFATHEMGGES